RPGAFQDSGGRVFPTARNSGMSGDDLRAAQLDFFRKGITDGKSPAELRGQAAEAGYTRLGGVYDPNEPLAAPGGENRLRQAIQEQSPEGPSAQDPETQDDED